MHNRSQSDSNLRDASLPISYEDITSRIQRLRQASSSYTSLPKTSENEKYFSEHQASIAPNRSAYRSQRVSTEENAPERHEIESSFAKPPRATGIKKLVKKQIPKVFPKENSRFTLTEENYSIKYNKYTLKSNLPNFSNYNESLIKKGFESPENPRLVPYYRDVENVEELSNFSKTKKSFKPGQIYSASELSSTL